MSVLLNAVELKLAPNGAGLRLERSQPSTRSGSGQLRSGTIAKYPGREVWGIRQPILLTTADATAVDDELVATGRITVGDYIADGGSFEAYATDIEWALVAPGWWQLRFTLYKADPELPAAATPPLYYLTLMPDGFYELVERPASNPPPQSASFRTQTDGWVEIGNVDANEQLDLVDGAVEITTAPAV